METSRLLQLRVVNRALILAVGATMAAWTRSPSLAAERADSAAEAQTLAEDLKSLEDPTILKRRVWLETEWNSYRDGSDNLEETLAGLWAWRISACQEWAVRLKLPYEWSFAGRNSGDSDKHGIGDIKLATGTAFRLNDRWRVGAGLELRIPTAQDNLGDNVWRLQEIATLSWDATPWLTFSPSVEYNESIAEENGASPQNYVELFFPATCLLPHLWSVTARYEAKVDFEADNYVTQSAKFTLAKQLANPPLNLALSFEKPFNTANKDFQVNFVITWFFPSKKQ
jgi:hypothetical protein